jgi:hypothetical protein
MVNDDALTHACDELMHRHGHNLDTVMADPDWAYQLLTICSYLVWERDQRYIGREFDRHFHGATITWITSNPTTGQAFRIFENLTSLKESYAASLAILRQALWLRGHIEGALRVGQYLTWLEAALAGPATADRGTP